MAMISEFQTVTSDVQRLHGPVRCGYRHFTIDGEVVLQLDTYGSDVRAIPDKISQSIQLNHESARELIRIIAEAFPSLLQ